MDINMDIMEKQRRHTALLNPKLLRTCRYQQKCDNGYRHRHHHHHHHQLPSPSLSVSMIIGILLVVVVIIIKSPLDIIEDNNFISVVSATKQTYTIQTPRISSLTKSNIGWCIIPRGGMDTNEEDNNKTTPDVVSSSSITTNNVIRIRRLDGTIQKLLIPFDQWNTQSVIEIIRQSVVTSNSGISSDQPQQLQPQQISYNVTLPNGSIYTCHVSNENDADDTTNNYSSSSSLLKTSLENLGFKHGALVTIRPNKSNDHKSSTEQASQSIRSKKWMTSHNNKNPPHERRFDPYPELAKDYDTAVRNAKIRRNTAGGLTSYSTIAALQSSLHTVEPQSIGMIQRIYMCHVAAAQFHARCTSSSMDDKANRPNGMALLLGTITTERKDLNQPKRARTSLSSTVEGDQYCFAARVHAIWEPSPSKVITTTTTTTPNDTLDETKLLLQHLSPSETTNVIRVAQYLGLQPIGWMFSYSNDRTGGDIKNDGGLPVWGMEIDIGARLQIEYMKRYCNENHHSTIISNNDDLARTTNMVPRFGTLAMDARTGATEAFQLSDVAVQMVAEDMLVLGEPSFQASNGRYITTRHPVIVDGKETNQLDSVLCLVNVALLSHSGMFTGQTATLSTKTKRDGRRISNKIRKAIVKAIVDDDNDQNTIGNGDATNKLFEIISDFNILLALDGMLNENDSEQLCRTLYKWARGQKRSVKLDSQLKERLRRALDIS